MDIILYLFSLVLWRHSCAIVNQGYIYNGIYRNHPKILTFGKTGLKTCARHCLYHKSCYGFNYNSTQLVCALLRSGGDSTQLSVPDSMFSYISTWSLTDDVCYPNPCSANEQCMKTKAGSYFCRSDESLCRGVTCPTGRYCHSEENSYQCKCPEGYLGDHCQCYLCPCGWAHHDGKCYYLSYGLTYWGGARTACLSMGGILAEPRTTTAINFLKSKAMERKIGFWLGGHDKIKEKEWRWDSNSDMISVTGWAPGQPDNTLWSEHCLHINRDYSYNWNDAKCGVDKRYICQKNR